MDRSHNKYRIGFIACLLTLSACKQSTSGIVVDETNNPIGGVTVLAANSYGNTLTTTTNDVGEFDFTELEGNLSLVATQTPNFIDRAYTIVEFNRQNHVITLAVDDNPSDTDLDGLTDGEELIIGTNPFSVDSDDDSLSDKAESLLMEGFSPLALGVDPLYKNILLEIDWSGEDPHSKVTPLAISLLQFNFKRAPIENPNGETGIKLIVDDGRFGGGSAIDIPAEWDGSYQSESFFETQISPERSPYFYHTAAVGSINTSGGALFGYAYYYSRENFVTTNFAALGPIEPLAEALLIQHELGHNLFLYHGGDDNIRCKPNYPSVMNYNPYLTLSTTYSKGRMPTLDESNLDETIGVGLGPVDWDMDFLIESTPVQASVNTMVPINIIQHITELLNLEELPLIGGLFGGGRCGDTSTYEVLRDHNDWERIEANLGRYINDSMQVQIVEIFSPPIENKRIEDKYFPIKLLELLSESNVTKEDISNSMNEL